MGSCTYTAVSILPQVMIAGQFSIDHNLILNQHKRRKTIEEYIR